MATTQRESPLGPGKDKKPTRSLPRISTTPSMIPRLGKSSPKETTSSSCTTKARNVRNHIKPSLTSPSSPPSKLIKKQHDSSANRRRSFDQPNPIVTRKQPSKAHPKSNAPVKTVRRSVTTPVSPRKTPASPLKKAGKKSSIDSEPTLMTCVEAVFGDRYAFPDEIEEIANIGSDEDLVPFDQMELPDINPCTSVDVVMSDPMVLVIAPNKGTQDHKVQEHVEPSNQHGEECGIRIVDHESNNSDVLVEESTREFEGGKEMEEEKQQGREAKRPAVVSVKLEARKQQRHGDKDKGKKDSPVYNDVIEETASKLLEKRKNKVKALVGAFETVISLQD